MAGLRGMDGDMSINPTHKAHAAPRCGARTRAGTPCKAPAVRGRKRCRMHRGARGSGAPRGERNGNYRNGRETTEARRRRRHHRARVRWLGKVVPLFRGGRVKVVHLPDHLACERELIGIEAAELGIPWD